MKGFSFFLIYILIEFNASIPFWNIENSSKNLFYNNSSVELIIYDKQINNINIKLIKEIRNNENNITEQNYFQINENNKTNTSWEDIDSFYYVKERIFICPRGKYFLSEYFLDNQTLKEIKPDNFNRNETWDLKCHYNSLKDYIALSFLKLRERIFYFFCLSLNNWVEENKNFFSGFFDYKWIEDLDFQRIYAVFPQGDKFSLRRIYFFDTGNIIVKDTPIGNLSNYFYSCFDNNNIFYWINFNNSNDCKIGYSYNILATTNNEVNLIECPFKFVDNITINKINFIKNTRYIYYEIKNNINNEFYHGIYDIISNETLFNTKEDIIEFKPLTNNSMIAITNKSAYEICGIYKGDKCIDKCMDNEKLFINNKEKNYCKLNVNCSKYYSLPENNCVDSCNSFYFINESEKKCGYCRDFFPNRQYKIFSKNECIENLENSYYFVDKNLKIIDNCKDGCQNCFNRDTCESCKEGYVKKDNDCKEKSYLYIYILISFIIFIGIIIFTIFLIKCIYSRKNKRYEESLLKKINDELKQNSNE